MNARLLDCLIVCGFLLFTFSCKKENQTNLYKFSDLYNAKWQYENNPYSGIEILNGKLRFWNIDEPVDSSKVFDIQIKYELPEYANTENQKGSFLILSNKKETLYAELLGYGNGYFSFMAFPSGQIVVLSEKNQPVNKRSTDIKVEPKDELKNIDTTVVYWQKDFDTIRKKHEVKIGNDIHQIELKTYSLNDSSIIRINDFNKPIIYKDIYHDYITEITLKKGNNLILKSQVKKSTFKDSLDSDFLKYSVLRDVEYEFIRSNRLYFKAQINVPDADWSFGTDFAIFYRTEKKGRIDYWNIKDIGL